MGTIFHYDNVSADISVFNESESEARLIDLTTIGDGCGENDRNHDLNDLGELHSLSSAAYNVNRRGGR